MLAYGMQLPVQSQSTIFVEPWEAGAGVDELVTVAQRAEANGFDYVAVCDHVAIPRDLAPKMGAEWWDTMATLGYLAAVTERVRLLSHVYVLPYRHPLVAAKAFCTLDALSGGRAVLGVGAGHVADEFAVLGADFGRRGARLDEAIDVVRAAFTDEYPVADGPTWPVRDLAVRPRPLQPGGPPIWVGGSSPAALRRAADRGDGWLPQGPPAMGMAEAVAFIHERRATAGRADAPFTVGGFSVLHVGEPTWDVGEWCLAGSPERIAGKLRRQADVGVDVVQLRFRARTLDELCDQLDAFGADVAPLLT